MKPLAATISPLVQREELPEENDKELPTKPDDNAIQREVAPEEESDLKILMSKLLLTPEEIKQARQIIAKESDQKNRKNCIFCYKRK